jgi:hypothetical protein
VLLFAQSHYACLRPERLVAGWLVLDLAGEITDLKVVLVQRSMHNGIQRGFHVPRSCRERHG